LAIIDGTASQLWSVDVVTGTEVSTIRVTAKMISATSLTKTSARCSSIGDHPPHHCLQVRKHTRPDRLSGPASDGIGDDGADVAEAEDHYVDPCPAALPDDGRRLDP